MKTRILLSAISFLFISGCFSPSGPQVCINNECVNVELALTDQQHAQGLQYRDSLDRDKGMLFVFGQPVEVSFWMKNTLIPLDIIWIDESRKIIYIQKNAAPCFKEPCPSYGPQKPAQYVLEVNAGWSDAHRANIGDFAEFRFMDQK